MIKQILISSFFLASLIPGTALASNDNGYNSELNHASYWGENCKKFDNLNVEFWDSTRDDVIKVIVKGGTENKVYTTGPFTSLKAAVNQKSGKPYGISHVIECYGVQEQEELCEYDQNLLASDPNCKEGDDTPQVLGETKNKVQTAKTLPNTGVSSVMTTLFGMTLVGASTFVAHLARREQIK